MFATLTVEENLSLSFRRVQGPAAVRRPASTGPTSCSRSLGRRRNQAAGTLSGGEQRMLSMARVLVEVPKVLIADELSLGLAPIIVDELYESLAPPPRRGHGAAHRRAAGRPRPRALRPGRHARPRRRVVGRAGREAGAVVNQAFDPAGTDRRAAGRGTTATDGTTAVAPQAQHVSTAHQVGDVHERAG